MIGKETRSRGRRLMFAVAALSIGALFAGCAGEADVPSEGSDVDAPDAGGLEDEAADDGPAEATAASLVPEDVRAAGVIKVGTGNYRPDQYLDDDGVTVLGWSVDILRAIGERLDVEMDIISTDFPGILPGVQAGRYDIGSSSYGVTEERLESVDFVTYYENIQFVVVREGNEVGLDPDDLCGRSMGAVQGALSAITGEQLSADCEAAGQPPVDISVFPAFDNVYLAIENGRVEFSVVNSSTRLELPETIEAIGDGFAPSDVGFIFDQDRTDLRDAVAAAMQEIVDDGTYMAILEEWEIPEGAITQVEVLSQGG